MLSSTRSVNSGKSFLRVAKIQTRERPVHQRSDIGMLAMPALALELADAAIGTAAFPLGGGDQQVVSRAASALGYQSVGMNPSASCGRRERRYPALPGSQCQTLQPHSARHPPRTAVFRRTTAPGRWDKSRRAPVPGGWWRKDGSPDLRPCRWLQPRLRSTKPRRAISRPG